jgi:hypothetical protein
MRMELDGRSIMDPVLGRLNFPLHNIPAFTSRPKVIGLLVLPEERVSPDRLGHHVKDFLAFKALLHASGIENDSQVWLSSVNTEPGNDEQADYLYTYQSADNTIASVRPQPDSKPICVIRDTTQLREVFLEEVTRLSRSGEALLIVFCGETNPEDTSSIYFDKYWKLRVSMEQLATHLTKPCTVTMMCPAPFSGGYLINPFLGTKPHFSKEQFWALVAVKTSGAFTDTIISAFTGPQSPLLVKDEHHGSKSQKLNEHAHVAGPKFDLFQIRIKATLYSQLSKLADKHMFSWEENLDGWLLGPRHRPSLHWWTGIWNQLQSTSATLLDVKADKQLHFLGSAFGGTSDSQICHLRNLARLELDGCPGDWNIHANRPTENVLREFLNLASPGKDICIQVLDLLQYRSSMMSLVDIIVDVFALERPQQRLCRDWDYDEFTEIECTENREDSAKSRIRRHVFGKLNAIMPKIVKQPAQNRDQLFDVRFHRPAQYLSSAITQKLISTCKNEAAGSAFVQNVEKGKSNEGQSSRF